MGVNFKFYGITNRTGFDTDQYRDHIRTCLRAGVRAIQIREKDLSPRELYELCKHVKAASQETQASILVNDRTDIALALDLHGVHLTENSMPVDRVRRLLGDGKLIGVSTHDAKGARQAAASGADFIVCGPLAPTESKPKGHALLPMETFREICLTVSIPVFALGGIHLANAAQYLGAGAFGVAGISLFMDPGDPVTRLRSLEKVLGHF